RLTRFKYYAPFPAPAFTAVSGMASLTFKDIDYVAIGRDDSANTLKKAEYALRNPGKLLSLIKIRGERTELDDMKTLLVRECGANPADLRFEQVNVEHHLAHAASSYFISPWEHAAAFTIDGAGDFVTATLSECKGKSIEIKERVYLPHSMGFFYTMVCEFIGYSKYGDEGKVMGLAPYGKDTYHDIFEQMVILTEKGFQLNPDFFVPFGSQSNVQIQDDGSMQVASLVGEAMHTHFGDPRDPNDDITQRDMDLAYGMQVTFERVYMHMLNRLHSLVPTERVAIAGGGALNSVANGKLFDQTPFTQTAIQPAAGDDGLAMGAALYVSQAMLDDGDRWEIANAYFGAEYSDSEVKSALESAGITDYQKLERDALIEKTATAIADGNVVGWYQGRSEWGPRALGNRSILANPNRDDMKDILNARIKRREWFRPFAPAVLAERQADVFSHDHPSPFMLHVYEINPEWRDKLPAVNHEDNTGRLQTVSRHENPMYYDLIKSFDQKTGIPVVLNTSFNENEPIVNTPEEAVDCYQRTKMDTLAICNFFCEKVNS
ncbi:MAG: carbamoyltransferase C-terminal domain-containing protein, partial [Chloroflexota bacterium]